MSGRRNPANEPHELEPLVEPAWLERHLDEPDLRVVDATVQVKLWPWPRIRSGRRDYEKAHVPGAVFADLMEISSPDAPRHTFKLPSPARFADAMSGLGIGEGTRVVIYDARENMWAARLWWMLRVFGFDHAAVLNGGWKAWTLEKRPVEKAARSPLPARFRAGFRPELVADKDEVLRAIGDETTCILSALGRRQHRGKRNEYGRRGHIPGASNVTAWEILDRRTMRYRPINELRARFGTVPDAARVITYCGGGVAAASDAFALHLLGHRNVAVYDGGLFEWCADRNLPLDRGE